MDGLRDYLMGVTAAALCCSAAVKLAGKGLTGSVVKMLAGIVMTLSILSPLVSVKLDSYEDFFQSIQSDAEDAALDGKNSAREAMAEIISEEVRTYILDKADALGVELTVEVELSADSIPVPSAVTLKGSVSPYARSVLSEYISDSLGIGTEAQTWIS